MSATVSWNDDRTVRVQFEIPWNQRDGEAAVEAALLMVNQAAGTVDLILDLRDPMHAPHVIEHVRAILIHKPLNLDAIVVVVPSASEEALSDLIFASAPEIVASVYFTATTQDAFDLLLERRLVDQKN